MHIPEIEKWRVATLLVHERGARTALETADKRIAEMKALDDSRGRAVWESIRKAVEELIRTELKEDERLN